MDRRLRNTEEGTGGLQKVILHAYGKVGLVLRLVSGVIGEASSAMHSNRDTVAQGLADKHMQHFHFHKNLAISV